MKLPDWFPEVGRPWNPAYQAAWDAMTSQERKWSFFIDLCIVGVVGIIWLITYCKGN
jgi:hypothetical protein